MQISTREERMTYTSISTRQRMEASQFETEIVASSFSMLHHRLDVRTLPRSKIFNKAEDDIDTF